MLRDEIRKNEEEEVANAHERLFNPPDDNKDDRKDENKDNNKDDSKNDEEKLVEKIVDEQLKKNELPEDDESESSEQIEEEVKEGKVENHNGQNEAHDDLNGSTVEIIQPTDLKPKHLGFTRTLLLAMFAAMIGTGSQFGYAVGVMNAPSEVNIFKNIIY